VIFNEKVGDKFERSLRIIFAAERRCQSAFGGIKAKRGKNPPRSDGA
jgi:hypothetical protein